jgi:hypothetical protein
MLTSAILRVCIGALTAGAVAAIAAAGGPAANQNLSGVATFRPIEGISYQLGSKRAVAAAAALWTSTVSARLVISTASPGVFLDDPDELKHAVETQHGGTATFAHSIPILETFEEQPVWEGVVHVFDLEGHPKATRAYAWSSPIEGSTKRRFFAVLHIPPIVSPLDAVRAAIVAERRKG